MNKLTMREQYPLDPKCKHEKKEVRNHNIMWHDGDVHCKACGGFIRYYDAG